MTDRSEAGVGMDARIAEEVMGWKLTEPDGEWWWGRITGTILGREGI